MVDDAVYGNIDPFLTFAHTKTSTQLDFILLGLRAFGHSLTKGLNDLSRTLNMTGTANTNFDHHIYRLGILPPIMQTTS